MFFLWGQLRYPRGGCFRYAEFLCAFIADFEPKFLYKISENRDKKSLCDWSIQRFDSMKIPYVLRNGTALVPLQRAPWKTYDKKIRSKEFSNPNCRYPVLIIRNYDDIVIRLWLFWSDIYPLIIDHNSIDNNTAISIDLVLYPGYATHKWAYR